MGSPIIGIDLGTANSVVAVMAESRPTVISNPQGTATTPSVVGFTARGERLVGHPAKNQLLANPKNTVFGVKRFMGRRMREVGEEERHLPYELKGNPDDLLRVAVGDGSYTPQEISAMILAELKLQAEEYLGQRVERAVITVPAYFNDAQRQATKDAGEIAGLKVERIINEATAAALTYGRGRKTEHKIAVFDLGGGTFNVSILEVGEGVFEVLATDGDPNVGGDAFTEAMRRAWAQSVEEKLGRPLVLDACTWHSIRQELELPKQHLSELAAVDVPVPRCLSWRRDLDLPAVTVTRRRLEDHYERLKHGIRSTCERALADARVRSSDIAEVVLVGGSTRIPGVQALARAVFPACTLFRGVNPDEVVAQGAAIGAGVLAGDVKDVVLLDVNTKTVGIRVHGGEMVVLIPRNATIPTSKKEFLCTTRDNQATATISVFQGDHPRAEENTLLGSIRLEGLGAAAAGEQRVEVEFSLDQNGILNVKATDKATGKAQEIKITGSSGLSKDEVERMRKDAEEHAAADTVRRELVDTKNRAEQVAYQVKKQLEEMGAKVPQDVRTKLEGAVSNLEERLKGDDKAAIEAALNNLMNAAGELQQAAQAAGAQAGAAEGGAGAASEAGRKEDVIDAEYEVTEEGKKA